MNVLSPRAGLRVLKPYKDDISGACGTLRLRARGAETITVVGLGRLH